MVGAEDEFRSPGEPSKNKPSAHFRANIVSEPQIQVSDILLAD